MIFNLNPFSSLVPFEQQMKSSRAKIMTKDSRSESFRGKRLSKVLQVFFFSFNYESKLASYTLGFFKKKFSRASREIR
jgi:hypothetical protein